MRARVRVGVTRRCSTGPTRSGLMENSIASSSLGGGAALWPGASWSSLSGSMVIVSVSTAAEAAMAAEMMSAWVVRLCTRAVDHVGAKLVEEQKADRQHHEAAEIEDDDAAGQRRRKARGQKSPREPRAARSLAAASAARRRSGDDAIALCFSLHGLGRAAYPSLNR